MSLLRFKENKKGQSLVEFALILPVLLLLVLGIVQFGIIFNGFISLTSAVREGARMAAVGTNTDLEVRQRVVDLTTTTGFVTIALVDVAVTPDQNNRDRGDEVEVLASASIDIILPILDRIIGTTYAVTSSSTMRVETRYIE